MRDRRELSQKRRTEILDAGVRVIAERGLCDTRISDIARRAGASAALVIYYFGSKDRLLSEALAYAEERFYAQTSAELDRLPDATARLARLIELSCLPVDTTRREWLDEWVLWLDLWARATRDPNVARDRERLDRRWRETIGAIVRAGQQSGEFGPVDPEDFAVSLASLLDGLAIQLVLEDREVTADRALRVCGSIVGAQLGFEWRGAPPAGVRSAAPEPSGPDRAASSAHAVLAENERDAG
jgi:AcrR family transcriptional regulator